MPGVVIDACLLDFPNEESSCASILLYVKNILNWKNELYKERWIEMYTCKSNLIMLYTEEFTSINTFFENLFYSKDFSRYDPHTLAGWIKKMLANSRDLESDYLLTNLEFEEVSITPSLSFFRCPPEIAKAIKKSIMTLAIVNKTMQERNKYLHLIVNNLDGR
jgi:hypothetical protein